MKNEVINPAAKKSPNPAKIAFYVGLPLARRSFEKCSHGHADNKEDEPVQCRRMRRHSILGVVEVRTLLSGWLEADSKPAQVNPEMKEFGMKSSSLLLRCSLDGGRLNSADYLPPLRKKQDSHDEIITDKVKVLEGIISVQLIKVADMLTHSKDLADAFASAQNPFNLSPHVYRKAWEAEKLALQKEKSGLEVTIYFLRQALDGSSEHAVALQGEVDSLRIDTERLKNEIHALATSSERLRTQESEAQAKLRTLEIERDRHHSQIADLRSMLTCSESECLKLESDMGTVEVENAAAKLVIMSMLETEENIRGDIDSLRNLLIEQSTIHERERNKSESETRELIRLLNEEQSKVVLAMEEIERLSAALEKEKAEKHAELQEMVNLKSRMEIELVSNRKLIMAMQEQETKQLCYLSTLREELEEMVVERSYLQAQMNASQDHSTEMASKSNKELREAKESMERMDLDLRKAREAETLANERIVSLCSELSSSRKTLKQKGLFQKAARSTAFISTCSLLAVVLSGIFRR